MEYTIIYYIEKMADVIPGETAIVCGDKSITYGELKIRISQIAFQLQKYGIGENGIVGVYMKRSVDMIAAILGILKSGAAYLPIDPSYPSLRVDYMIEDSGIEILAVDDETRSKNTLGRRKINISEISGKEETVVKSSQEPHELAYMLYTSGSTGAPKGVMIEHHSIVNLRDAMHDYMAMAPGMRIFSMTRMVFDVFVVETLVALSYGMTIIMATDRELRNPRLLSKRILENNIDMIQMTPSTVLYLASCDEELTCLKDVKTLVIAGEAFPISLLKQMKKYTNARIYNFYGPTEACVYSVAGEVTDCTEQVDIGVPLRNFEAYLIDESGKVSDRGELYLGGTGLARGYWKKDELTQKKFVRLPEISNQILYKTGDLMERLPDGKLNYIRRIDQQIKLNGFRIELGEIENVMLSVYGVKQAAVVVRNGKDESKFLCGFYTVSKEVSEQEIRRKMANALPNYMIPSMLVCINSIPVNASGKIDRQMLASCEISQ